MPVIYKGNRRINVPDEGKPHWEETVKPEPVEVEEEPQVDAESPTEEE